MLYLVDYNIIYVYVTIVGTYLYIQSLFGGHSYNVIRLIFTE